MFATCLLLLTITNSKFFIHRTVAEGKIDIESFAESEVRSWTKLGYQMCPGIKDFDEILEDVRMHPASVKEELWPWRHVGAKSCKLWHKPRDCFVQRDEAEGNSTEFVVIVNK